LRVLGPGVGVQSSGKASALGRVGAAVNRPGRELAGVIIQ
jgi:hypothetical protein